MLTHLSQKHELPMSPNRRFWNEEANSDSLYHIYLKKITYSSNNELNDSDISDPGGYRRSDRKVKKDETLNSKRITRVDQSEDRRRRSKSVDKNEIQSLQWETRRVRVLKAATMDHIIEFILLLTPNQRDCEITSSRNHHCTSQMEEERNDVTHIMHVLFCTYRIYCTPRELFAIFAKYSTRASPQQLRFVFHYWLRYYPEDYLTPLDGSQSKTIDSTSDDASGEQIVTSTESPTNTSTTTTPVKNTSIKNNTSTTPTKSITSSSSSSSSSASSTSSISSSSTSSSTASASSNYNINANCGRRSGKKDSDLSEPVKSKPTRSQSSSVSSSASISSQSSSSNQRILLDLLLELPCIDDTLYRKAHLFVEQHKTQLSDDSNQLCNKQNTNGNNPINKAPSYCIIDLDTKFVAQQLTAIDLENFLSLKPYTLLSGHRHNPRVQNLIRNFNLLSKHVVVTILKAHSPDLVTNHWINIAQQLRKMKNFNSLKAVIAGLSNESVFRLKQTVWSKISKSTEATFKHLSTIVDDVDNQTLLRQTQLEIEGTAKVSIEEESFGTIPYLGTFLTDLTFIDSKSSSYIENPKSGGKRLINLEKCCKQFEIITQIHLLQQNIKAALSTFHQSQQLSGLSQLPSYNKTSTAPRIVVARLFRAWFQDSIIVEMTDNDCYKLSLALESSQSQKK